MKCQGSVWHWVVLVSVIYVKSSLFCTLKEIQDFQSPVLWIWLSMHDSVPGDEKLETGSR